MKVVKGQSQKWKPHKNEVSKAKPNVVCTFYAAIAFLRDVMQHPNALYIRMCCIQKPHTHTL